MDHIISGLIVFYISLLTFVGSQDHKDAEIIIYWSDLDSGLQSCRDLQIPRDDSPTNHRNILDVVKRKSWPSVWLPLRRQSGTWKWIQAGNLDANSAKWAANEPTDNTDCAVLDADSFWRAKSCDSMYYGYCLKTPYVAAAGGLKVYEIVIIALCALVAVIVIGILIFIIYKRYVRVQRAAGQSATFGDQRTGDTVKFNQF